MKRLGKWIKKIKWQPLGVTALLVGSLTWGFSIKESLSIPKANAFNLGALGLQSVGMVMGYSQMIGGKFLSKPDIQKALMILGLGATAHNAQKQWETAAETFANNANEYKKLADAIRDELNPASSLRTGGAEGISLQEGEDGSAPSGFGPRSPNSIPHGMGSGVLPYDVGGPGGDTGYEIGGYDGTHQAARKKTPRAQGSEIGGGDGMRYAARKRTPRAQGGEIDLPEVEPSCATGPITRMRLDENCRCKENNSCTKTTGRFFSMGKRPKGLSAVAYSSYRTLRQGGDSLYRGDTAMADSHLDAFEKNAARIEQFSQASQKRIQQVMDKAKGRGAYKKYKKNTENFFSRLVNRAKRTLGPRKTARLAQTMGGNWSTTLGKPSSVSSSSRKELIAKAERGVIPRPMEKAARIMSAPAPVSSTDMPTEEYEYREDITSLHNSGDNLWKIISVRYMKFANP